MTDTPLLPVAGAVHAACRELAERAAAARGTWLQRFSVGIEPCEPALLAACAAARPRVFFASRETGLSTLGLGAAMVVEDADAWPAIERMLERLPGAAFLGGQRFDTESTPAPEWAAFGASYYVLPRWEITRRNERVTLTLTATPGEWCEPPPFGPPAVGGARLERSLHAPDRAGWQRAVGSALDAIQAGRFRKVVLARASMAQAGRAFLADWLAKPAGGAFRFLIEPADGRAFAGVSPELLFRRAGVVVSSEALAGTRGRGATRAEDERMAIELATSPKEELEFELVATAIHRALESVCVEVGRSPHREVARFGHVMHLRSSLRGRLREGVRDADILRALHPTPATCGDPRSAAMTWLGAHEGFDRGFYAGPVGRVSADVTELCVAIRSALVESESVRVYAGAGIVAGSDPAREWEELDRKTREFLPAP